MKKKLIALLLALSLVAALGACAGQKDDPDTTPTGSGTPETVDPAGKPGDSFTFHVGETPLYVGMDMEAALAALGEPNSYFEAESCAFEGLDKTYTYSGFVITTRPDGEKDYISSIRLTDDSVTTAEGLYIGSAEADVVATYGEADAPVGLYVYVKGAYSLQILVENGAVTSIEYLEA